MRRAAREEARGHIDLNHVERHFRAAAAVDPQDTWASSFAKELSLVGTHFPSTATCTRLLSAILVLLEPNSVEGIVMLPCNELMTCFKRQPSLSLWLHTQSLKEQANKSWARWSACPSYRASPELRYRVVSR